MAQQAFIGNLRQAPVWLKDFGSRDHLLPFAGKLNVPSFTDAAGVTVTASAAAQNATSVTVAALTPSVLANTTIIAGGGTIIPSGTTLYFGGAKVATLTADAHIGDTTITVAALPTALTGGEVATYSAYNQLSVPSGKVVSRTYAQRDAFTGYHPAISTEDEILLVLFDRPNIRMENDVELVRPKAVVAENFLPDYGTGLPLGTSASPTALLTALRGIYQCIQAV